MHENNLETSGAPGDGSSDTSSLTVTFAVAGIVLIILFGLVAVGLRHINKATTEQDNFKKFVSGGKMGNVVSPDVNVDNTMSMSPSQMADLLRMYVSSNQQQAQPGLIADAAEPGLGTISAKANAKTVATRSRRHGATGKAEPTYINPVQAETQALEFDEYLECLDEGSRRPPTQRARAKPPVTPPQIIYKAVHRQPAISNETYGDVVSESSTTTEYDEGAGVPVLRPRNSRPNIIPGMHAAVHAAIECGNRFDMMGEHLPDPNSNSRLARARSSQRRETELSADGSLRSMDTESEENYRQVNDLKDVEKIARV